MSTPGDAENAQQPDQPGPAPYEQTQPGQTQPGQTQSGQPPYGHPGPYAQQAPYGQQGQYGQAQHPWPAARPVTDEHFWAPATHWGALVVWLATSGVLAFVVPLVIMQTKGNDSPVVRRHAVASVNFQLSMLIYAAVCGLVAVAGAIASVILVGLPVLVLALVGLLAVAVVSFVLPIIASVKAANGEEYAYPFSLSLFS